MSVFFAVTCPDGSTTSGLVCSDKIPHTPANSVESILTILFIVLGALALLMVVIGGFRYVISSGKPDETAAAKRQIMYSLAGLILAALAAVIVQFVVNQTPQ